MVVCIPDLSTKHVFLGGLSEDYISFGKKTLTKFVQLGGGHSESKKRGRTREEGKSTSKV